MNLKFGWSDSEEIGIQLAEKFPEQDPLAVRFVALRDMVQALPGFVEDPASPVNEKKLEAIQMAWLEEKQHQ